MRGREGAAARRPVRASRTGSRGGSPSTGWSGRAAKPEDWIENLQRTAGNQAVADLLGPGGGPPWPTIQRAPATYEPGESERATDRGVIAPDVRLLGGAGSGYNASPDSILIADFRPNSAVVRTSAAEDLARGKWLRIVEGDTRPYAILGFTDATGPEGGNTTLRADRARSVAAQLPGTAKRGVVGAAPTGDFIAAGNATPEERALNRAVLIRLPPDELRAEGQVDAYAAGAVAFWRANPTKTVTDLLTFLSGEVGEQLARNAVPAPNVVPGTTVKGTGTLAFFTAVDWQITVDATALTSALPQKGVTHTAALSTLTVPDLAYLAQACYHEGRHAEQDFQAARLSAEESKGTITPDLLARRLGIRADVAAAAITESATVLPDVIKAKAAAYRTFMKGGRHIPYRTWNEGLKNTLGVIGVSFEPKIAAHQNKGAAEIRTLWELYLHPVIDRFLRKKYSFDADDLDRDLKASPHHDQVDLDVRQHLTETARKLFMMLVKERDGSKIPDAAALAAMPADDALMAKLAAQIWLLDLQVALWDVADAADAAYHAYPHEKDAYEVGAMVTDSVIEQGAP